MKLADSCAETKNRNYGALALQKDKKLLQCMVDVFHMKAIRMMESHLKKSLAEIVPLIKKNKLEFIEENNDDCIAVRQFIHIGDGSVVALSGSFKRNHNSQAITMPIVDSFRLSFQCFHTGFPCPSQRASWALSDRWIDAMPLKPDLVPFYQQITFRRKQLAQRLFTDQSFAQKVRSYFQLKREVFDKHFLDFLPLHSQLQQVLQNKAFLNDVRSINLNQFYETAKKASSPFDYLTGVQKQLLQLFVQEPMQKIEEEWLNDSFTPLRNGSPQEKWEAIDSRLKKNLREKKERLDPSKPHEAYLLHQGIVLGESFQAIGIQYLSEKIGFAPYLLGDFERKLQSSAFKQLISFLDECENCEEKKCQNTIKQDLHQQWISDISHFECDEEEEESLPILIVNELEYYFTSSVRLKRA